VDGVAVSPTSCSEGLQIGTVFASVFLGSSACPLFHQTCVARVTSWRVIFIGQYIEKERINSLASAILTPLLTL